MSIETKPTNGGSRPGPAVVIVTGVSGSGKSTIGALLGGDYHAAFPTSGAPMADVLAALAPDSGLSG